jgi:hypothetical protein
MPLRVFHSLPTLSIFVRRVTSMMMLTWMSRGVIQVPFDSSPTSRTRLHTWASNSAWAPVMVPLAKRQEPF